MGQSPSDFDHVLSYSAWENDLDLPVDPDEMLKFASGEADAELTARVEAAIESHPGVRARVEMYREEFQQPKAKHDGVPIPMNRRARPLFAALAAAVMCAGLWTITRPPSIDDRPVRAYQVDEEGVLGLTQKHRGKTETPAKSTERWPVTTSSTLEIPLIQKVAADSADVPNIGVFLVGPNQKLVRRDVHVKIRRSHAHVGFALRGSAETWFSGPGQHTIFIAQAATEDGLEEIDGLTYDEAKTRFPHVNWIQREFDVSGQ